MLEVGGTIQSFLGESFGAIKSPFDYNRNEDFPVSDVFLLTVGIL